jgi:hypothetical protein
MSKEEVAVVRKGSGGAGGSTSRNAGLAGPAPQNGRIRTPAQNQAKRPVVGLWVCGLQYGGAENDLLAIRLKSSKTLFSVARTSNSRCLVLYLVQRCDARLISFWTWLSGTAPSRCIEAARAPLERALDPGRPRPRRGSRGSWGRGRGVVASGKLQELSLQ